MLNTTDFNLPQIRERIFIVSIRKDVDDGKFEFPVGEGLHCDIYSFLESNVDEKYYFHNRASQELLSKLIKGNQIKKDITCCSMSLRYPYARDIARPILARYDSGIQTNACVGTAVVERIYEM